MRSKAERLKDLAKVHYTCLYCETRFTKFVGTMKADGEGGKGVSTQVICPNCGNFLETWW